MLTKDQVTLQLNRMLKEAEPQSIDHERLAQQGLPYEERRKLVELSGGNPDQAEAIRTCLELVEKYYHID